MYRLRGGIQKRIIIMRPIFAWSLFMLAICLGIVVAYQWLDRPIVLWVHAHIADGHRGVLHQFGRYPDPLIPVAVIAFLILGVRAVMMRSLPINFQASIFVCSLSVLVTEVAKNELKFIFGRTWPESWTGNNPSFIHDGVYGFNFMHSGSAYQSFPSGHMAATCAVFAVLWNWYPQWRWFCLVAVAIVGLVLIATNSHFLSDLIGGAALGIGIGRLVAAIWKAFASVTKSTPK